MGIISKLMMLIGSGYDPMTTAYINGMQAKPSTDLIKIIDTIFVKNKKTVNGVDVTTKQILAKFKLFYLANINDSNDSYRNICSNNYHGTKEGIGLVWDSFWGYSNPSKTGYVDTHFNPASDGGSIFTQNSAGFGCYLHNNIATTSSYPMGIKNINTIGFQTNADSFAVNQLALLSRASMPFRAGLHGFFRTIYNSINAKNQNLGNTDGANISTDIPSGNIYLFNCNGLTAHYDGGLNCVYAGGVLTDDEFKALNLIVNEYLKECLYLKYGTDNWGVKMAKSYFDTLHNFEPYEAWEIYEFIKRMQPNYVDSVGVGYYYNTFGPAGQNKSVCDFLMLFKAGGNLAANAWIKTGATLRCNQDGVITSSNTMPAYMRGTNLGIVTVSSTDGFNLVTSINVNGTYNSVNSLYGVFPKFFGTLKTGGAKVTFNAFNIRMKLDFRGLPLATQLDIGAITSTFPAKIKLNLNDFVGGSGSFNMTINTWDEVSGNMTLFTNEFKYYNLIIYPSKSITGSLANIIVSSAVNNIQFTNNGIIEGLAVWNKSILSYDLSFNNFNITAVNKQLLDIDNYFVGAVVPIKSTTILLNGAGMGIPTGGLNNTNRLSIIAKHVAAGFVATINVNT